MEPRTQIAAAQMPILAHTLTSLGILATPAIQNTGNERYRSGKTLGLKNLVCAPGHGLEGKPGYPGVLYAFWVLDGFQDNQILSTSQHASDIYLLS